MVFFKSNPFLRKYPLPYQYFICKFSNKMLFSQENNESIFVKNKTKKRDKWLNFKFWVFIEPFNQITLK